MYFSDNFFFFFFWKYTIVHKFGVSNIFYFFKQINTFIPNYFYFNVVHFHGICLYIVHCFDYNFDLCSEIKFG